MIDNVVYMRVDRPDVTSIARAAASAMSDLYEALEPQARQHSLMSPHMRPVADGVRMAGPAVTARCAPGDNLMMHRALLLAQRGDVLVIAAGTRSGAQWGMLAAAYAERKGLAGVVVHGCVRDLDYLREHKCAVWSTSISPAHPEKHGPGAVNVPIECDGVRVRPGDVISADGDGVLVIPRELLANVLDKAELRARQEQISKEKIEAGRSLFEVHDLQSALDRAGVVELDKAWGEA